MTKPWTNSTDRQTDRQTNGHTHVFLSLGASSLHAVRCPVICAVRLAAEGSVDQSPEQLMYTCIQICVYTYLCTQTIRLAAEGSVDQCSEQLICIYSTHMAYVYTCIHSITCEILVEVCVDEWFLEWVCSVCMYVCMYVYVYVCDTRERSCMHTNKYTHMQRHKRGTNFDRLSHAYVCANVPRSNCACIHTRARTCKDTQIPTYTHVHCIHQRIQTVVCILASSSFSVQSFVVAENRLRWLCTFVSTHAHVNYRWKYES
jgi:hypothetical protein